MANISAWWPSSVCFPKLLTGLKTGKVSPLITRSLPGALQYIETMSRSLTGVLQYIEPIGRSLTEALQCHSKYGVG